MARRRPFRRLQQFIGRSLLGGGASGASRTARLRQAAAAACFAISPDGTRGYGVETMEPRYMLTVYGPADGQFEYIQAEGIDVRVAWHDMTFEAIGVDVPTSGSTTSATAPIPPIGSSFTPDEGTEDELTPDTVNPAPTFTASLFTIYVMQSNLDSWMSIAEVPSPTTTGERAMEPFSGSPGINVVDDGIPTSDTLIAAPIGTNVGGVYLGAVHNGTGDAGLPILTVPFNPNAVSGPYNPGATLTAGLYMSPVALATDGAPIITNGLEEPNDIGRFLFGGAITGNVDIPAPTPGTVPAAPASQGGNIGMFYAGAILTGDATGETTTDDALAYAQSETPNFVVGGDIRDLITAGGIGGGRGAATDLENSQYITDFRAVVAGTVGEIDMKSGGSFGTWDVEHLSSVYGLPSSLFDEHELEARVEGTTPDGDYFGPNDADVLATLTGYPLLPSDIFANDTTPDTPDIGTLGDPQYLGSIAESDPKTGLPEVDSHGNIIYEATVDGIFEGAEPSPESIDNYAVPLLAGQPISVTFTETVGADPLLLSLIDPDGRVVATNYSKIGVDDTLEATFYYTPDRPGIYTVSLTNPVGETYLDDDYYNITVTGVGNMGLGTMVAETGDIYDGGFNTAYEVDAGDLGAMIAGPGSNLASGIANSTNSVTMYVPDGSLRELKAGSIGYINDNEFGEGPSLDVVGTVGLIEAVEGPTTGVLDVSTTFDVNNSAALFASALIPQNETVPLVPVGGDFQVIDGQGTVYLDIATDQGIGDILAGNMATLTPSFMDVNADNVGNDGIIGLINVTGDLGTLAAGGPGIVTNTGGYVQYMRVGGEMYEDAYFGGSLPRNTVYAPGQTVSYTDDTGATVTFSPEGPTNTIVYNNGLTNTTETFGPQISLSTYGIRDKGGGVIVDATAIGGSMSITATGGDAANNQANISLIQFVGNSDYTLAAGTTVDANKEPILVATAGTPPTESTGTALANGTTALPTGDTDATTGLAVTGSQTIAGVTNTSSLVINGSATVNVLQIVVDGGVVPEPAIQSALTTTTTGTTTTSTSASTSLAEVEAGAYTSLTATGNVDAIINNTPGEIGAITAPGFVREIYTRGTLGLLSANGGTATILTDVGAQIGTAVAGPETANGADGDTEPTAAPSIGAFPAGDAFPFGLQTTGISVGGDVQTMESDGAMGNIDVGGSIETLTANANGELTAGVVNGIDAPVLATGALLNVNIGQGIAASGSGNMSFAGLYATGDIGTVTNNNRSEADIRGNIVSLAKIDTITLGNGSIINAQVVSVAAFSETEAEQPGYNFPQPPIYSTSNPQFVIGKVTINGNGGIIGSFFGASDVGPITVGPAGFGIVDSDVGTLGEGVIGKITAGGYGIRDSEIEGGAVIEGISATGNGSQLPVTKFGLDVRESDAYPYEYNSGASFSPLNDLNAALGTSAATPEIADATDTGVLQDDIIQASTSLMSLTAQTVRTIIPATQFGEVEPAPFIPVVGELFNMSVSIAGNTNSINIRGAVDGLQVTTGTLGSFRVGTSVSRLGISVAGTIKSLVIPGNYGQQIYDNGTGTMVPDSYIDATGAQGIIQSLTIDGNLNGDITANDSIQMLTVKGSVVGNITALGQTTGLALNTLRVGGTISNGSLDVDGSAGTIITNGSLGAAGQSLTIVGGLKELEVGAKTHGSVLASNVNVMGPIGTLLVNGAITGALTVDGDVTTLRVNDSGAFANAISGAIDIGGRLHAAAVIGGNVAANITVNNAIGNFTIQRGSLAYGATIASTLAAIGSFNITGGAAYGLFGALEEPDGVGTNINVSGNFGDGTDPAGIAAYSANRIIIRGSFLDGAAISLAGPLALLQVNGDLQAGAAVAANPLERLVVNGTNSSGIVAS